MTSRRFSSSAPDQTGLRERILDVSEILLDEEGPGSLSMREVARRVGVTHQAPYHHFPDREAILAELVTRGFVDLTGRLAKANERLGTGQGLAAAVDSGEAYVGFALDHPGLFRVMFRPELCDASRFPVAREAGDRAYNELVLMVRAVHPDQDASLLSQVYWAQVHGLAGLLLDGPLGLQVPSPAQRRVLARQALTAFARHMLGLPAGA